MRIGLIFGVLALTAVVFFMAVQSLPVEASRVASSADPSDSLDQEKLAQISEENSMLRATAAKLEEDMTKLEDDSASLTTSLDTALAEKDKLAADLAALQDIDAKQTDIETEMATLTSQLTDMSSEKDALASEKTELVQTIAILQEKLSTSQKASESLTEAAEAAAARIAVLEAGSQGMAENQEPQSLGEHSNIDLAEMASLKKAVEAQTRSATTMVVMVKAMKTQIEGLEADIADRETTIADFSKPQETVVSSPADMCQERTDALTIDKVIRFDAGTTSLTAESKSLLSALIAATADCMQDGITLDIESHTDTANGVASNLLLSNGRADAVKAFLSANGIPAKSIRPVGFGNSDPVADNSTTNGRLLNQRIVFDWN